MCIPSCSYLFTSDPRGILRMWKIQKAALQSDIHVTGIDYNALLLAVFTSSFRHRIMCIDASSKEEVMVEIIFSHYGFKYLYWSDISKSML